MMPIAIFYHCLFYYGNPPQLLDQAIDIIGEQMNQVDESGLIHQIAEFVIGINGGQESEAIANFILPSKSKKVFHGLQSRAENLTIVEIEKWVSAHPNWYILYFHAKGCTHPPGESYGDNISAPWRRAMMHYLIDNWRTCVSDLDTGHESVGCHFMRNMADGSQNIWAGNFWWATSNFLKTLPSIFARDRIKMSGIDALESRYEAEVWIGNGRLPSTKEYLPNGGYGVP